MTSRPLTSGEVRLVAAMFGAAVACRAVRIHRRKWWFGQPRSITMAPDGDVWFHPESPAYAEDFSCTSVGLQAFFLHEITHVWQVQCGLNLVWRRGLWSRYRYLPLVPGKPFGRYGIEQQAEIIRHCHLLRHGHTVPGASALADYEALIPFCRPPVQQELRA